MRKTFGERVDTMNGGVRKGGAEIFHNKKKAALNAVVARTFLLVDQNQIDLNGKLHELAAKYSIGLANVHTITVHNR